MKLPLVDAKTLIKMLVLKGYKQVRQGGSHTQFKNEKGILITVPFIQEETLEEDF